MGCTCVQLGCNWAATGDPGDLGGPGGPGDPGGQDSLDDNDTHSENIWFSWSRPSNYRGKLRCHACDGGRTEVTGK